MHTGCIELEQRVYTRLIKIHVSQAKLATFRNISSLVSQYNNSIVSFKFLFILKISRNLHLIFLFQIRIFCNLNYIY